MGCHFLVQEICFIHCIKSVYLSIPISQLTLPLLSPPWYPHICSPRLCLYFCFANKIVCLFHFSRFHILLEGLKKGTPKVLEQPRKVENCRDRHRSHYVYVTAEEANQESDISEVIKLVRHRVGGRTPKDFKATGDRRKLLP